MPFQFTADEVAGDNATGLTVNDNQLKHFMPVIHFYIAERNLSFKCLVGSDQQLLPRLPCRVKGSLHLCTPEATIAEQATVFPCKRNSLRHALVNNINAYFGKPVHIPFPGPVIA